MKGGQPEQKQRSEQKQRTEQKQKAAKFGKPVLKQQSGQNVEKGKKNAKKSMCPVMRQCGGCQMLDMPYAEQLKTKRKRLETLLKGICPVKDMIGMEDPLYYRNKVHAVFFVAGMLYQDTSFQRVCVTTVIAAIHVLILVASRDLGAALLFFVTYVVMLYVATKKVLYFAGGLAAGSAASVVAYHLFSHIRVRVRAWQNPLAYIDKEGYQISQSLFAIGTGGWFGMGLYQGLPDKIPVVKQDFIFSAVSEELGGIFALCLIMVCFSCFLMFLNIAMQMKDQFYKLVALGLGTIYAFQVFLTIGGVTKFIPSTGVTLPLVSYGGSSLLSSMIIFAVIQGLYILRQDEGEINASKSRKNRQNRKKTTGFENADIEKLS